MHTTTNCYVVVHINEVTSHRYEVTSDFGHSVLKQKSSSDQFTSNVKYSILEDALQRPMSEAFEKTILQDFGS